MLPPLDRFYPLRAVIQVIGDSQPQKLFVPLRQKYGTAEVLGFLGWNSLYSFRASPCSRKTSIFDDNWISIIGHLSKVTELWQLTPAWKPVYQLIISKRNWLLNVSKTDFFDDPVAIRLQNGRTGRNIVHACHAMWRYSNLLIVSSPSKLFWIKNWK